MKRIFSDPIVLLLILVLGSTASRATILIQDGREGEQINPLQVYNTTNPAAAFTNVTNATVPSNPVSPFPSNIFGMSSTSGLLTTTSTSEPYLMGVFPAVTATDTHFCLDVYLSGTAWNSWEILPGDGAGNYPTLIQVQGTHFAAAGLSTPGNTSTFTWVAVPNVVAATGRWYHVDLEVLAPSNSIATKTFNLTITDSTGITGSTGSVADYSPTLSSINNILIASANTTNAASLYIDNCTVTDDTPEFRYAYLPSSHIIRLWANAPVSMTSWTATVAGSGTNVTLNGALPFPSAGVPMSIPTLTDGTYTVTMSFANGSNLSPVISKTFTTQTPVWAGNTLGEQSVVIPPFTPLAVSGGSVNCLLRSYQGGSSGLWSQVTCNGTPILAGPMLLQALYSGTTYTATGGGPTYSTESATEVAGTTSWTAGILSGTTAVDYDYDGMMKVTLTVGTSGTTIIDGLTLVIPLLNQQASLMHTVTDLLRWHAAQAIPAGTGTVWNSTNIARPTSAPGIQSYGPYVPYAWIGGPTNGISWFSENTKDWILNDAKPTIEITRDGTQTCLLVHFINSSGVITRPRTIVFGLMATPVKPMPSNPDYRQWQPYATINPQGPLPFSLLPTCYELGSQSLYSQCYPAFHNTSIYNAYANARSTGLYDSSFITTWMNQFSSAYNVPSVLPGFPTIASAIQYYTNFALTNMPMAWPNYTSSATYIKDGMEGTATDPLQFSGPGLYQDIVTTNASPFKTSTFPTSSTVGSLQDNSNTGAPSLGRDNFGASTSDKLRFQFDVSPISGSYSQWGFYIGTSSTNAYATVLQFYGTGIIAYGAPIQGGSPQIFNIPNITVNPNSWYHFDVAINPTSGIAANRTFSVTVTDSSGNKGSINNIYFYNDFTVPVSRFLIAPTNSTSGSLLGVMNIDNVSVQSVGSNTLLQYVNPHGLTWDSEVQTYLDEWSIYDITDPGWAAATNYDLTTPNYYLRYLRENAATRGYSDLSDSSPYADPVPSRNDMEVYYINQMLQTYANGVFLDNIFLKPNYCTTPGPGYVDDYGRVRAGMNIFGLRSLVKRLAVMQYEMGMKPMVALHATNFNVIPIMSFATMKWDMEGSIEGSAPDPNNYNGDPDYYNYDLQTRYDLDTTGTGFVLAESTGQQTGTPTVIVDSFTPAYAPNDSRYAPMRLHLLRTALAVALTHEMKMPMADDSILASTAQLLLKFGYGASDCTDYPYWGTTAQPVVVSGGVPVKTLVAVRPNQTLVMLGSYDTASVNCSLSINFTALGLPATANAFDYETGALLTKSNGSFTINVPADEFKLVEIINASTPN